MAFISNVERQSLIGKVNQSYTLKKILILLEVLALIGFIVVVFLSFYLGWNWVDEKNNDKLTGLGIGMIVYAVLVAALGIYCVVLIFMLRSPRNIKRDIRRLETSAISGKKIDKSLSYSDVVRERRNPKKYGPKKKGK